MTRATHWDRGWPKKVAACGANAAPHGSNIRTDVDAVTCRRCRKIIDWQAPIKPVERCPSIGPGFERFRCGLEAGHDGSHSALMETSAPWFPAERRATVAEGDPVIGYRHNPCRSCGTQVTTPGGLLCLDCICAKMDAAGLTMRDIVPAMRQQISGAADGPKTSSSTVQPESEKRARAAQDARKSHEAGRLPKSEQNRTGSVAIREPSAASDSTLTVPSRALVAKLEVENRTARLVGRLETRLALLEQHLDEIVKLHTSLHAAERDPMAIATDVMELDEQLNAAIEAAQSATVKS